MSLGQVAMKGRKNICVLRWDLWPWWGQGMSYSQVPALLGYLCCHLGLCNFLALNVAKVHVWDHEPTIVIFYISAYVSCYYWKMCKCLGSGQNMIPLVPEGYVSAQGHTDWDGLCYNPGPSWCLGLSCDLKPFPGLWTCSNWIAALMEIGERLVSEAFFFVCSFLFFFFSFCLI